MQLRCQKPWITPSIIHLLPIKIQHENAFSLCCKKDPHEYTTHSSAYYVYVCTQRPYTHSPHTLFVCIGCLFCSPISKPVTLHIKMAIILLSGHHVMLSHTCGGKIKKRRRGETTEQRKRWTEIGNGKFTPWTVQNEINALYAWRFDTTWSKGIGSDSANDMIPRKTLISPSDGHVRIAVVMLPVKCQFRNTHTVFDRRSRTDLCLYRFIC